MNVMNIVFMGTPDYAVRILRHLKEAGFNIKRSLPSLISQLAESKF